MTEDKSPGTIKENEYHPAADSAFAYVKEKILQNPMIIESFASTAMSGNRTAEICHETIHRIMNGMTVSDRYVLGLAWTFKTMEDL